jgi:hypothetical protein
VRDLAVKIADMSLGNTKHGPETVETNHSIGQLLGYNGHIMIMNIHTCVYIYIFVYNMI